MSRGLDAACAKALGWANVAPDCHVHDGKDWCGTDPSGTGGYYGTGRKIVPHFSTDRAAAVVLENEIQRRGLQERYVEALYPLVGAWQFGMSTAEQWLLIRATPEQKCKAFLEAVSV